MHFGKLKFLYSRLSIFKFNKLDLMENTLPKQKHSEKIHTFPKIIRK